MIASDMSELPGLPPSEVEWKIRQAAYEFRMEQARLLAEENESKIWRLPLEGALYWARKNQVPAAVWLHGYFVRYRTFRVVGELLLWSAALLELVGLIWHLSSR
jgi:hypothetical protein